MASWLPKLRTALALPWGDQLLVLELAVELARARFEVSWLPARCYARGLGTLRPANESPPGPQIEPAMDLVAARVSGFTRSLAALLPWRCTCLVRALAARRVLARRGCPTALYLGVRRPGRLETSLSGPLEAHAWLVCGSRVVTGRAERDRHAPLAVFAGPS